MRLPVAASIVIVVESGGRYLMVEEQRGKESGAVWYFPSGALEPGESLDVAARREVLEEAGYEVEPLDLIAVDHGAFRDLSGLLWWRFVVSARLRTAERRPVDEPDILRIEWMDVAGTAGLRLRCRDVVALCRRFESGRGLPLDACTFSPDGKLEGFFA